MVVGRCIAASVAIFGLSTGVVFLLPPSRAQTAASVSSSSAGSHPVTATVPTGPVHPPTGPVQPPTGTVPLAPSGSPPGSAFPPHLHHDSEHHHHANGGGVAVFYPVPVPYAVDLGGGDAYADPNDPNADDQDANYQGGPTVFDRRGSGAESYVPPVDDLSAPRAEPLPAAPDADPPEPTTLVFKDGHKLEVENYAIIGQTLLDLTPGHTRRVPLADLDLNLTRQQNDDRGIVFQVPETTQVN